MEFVAAVTRPDRDPILGSGTDQIRAAATDHKWTVIDMAADWSVVYPRAS